MMSQSLSLNALQNLRKMNTFENGIFKAHSEALKSPLDKAHGAVIINDNKIIGFGHNYPRHGTITSKIKYCIL
jgi:hypothetical protein